MGRMSWTTLLLAAMTAALSLGVAGVAAPVADDLKLEQQLLQRMEGLVSQLELMGARNVGVLRFIVQLPESDALPANVGLLNRRLTAQAEAALGFALPITDVAEKQMGYLSNATEVARSIEGAFHYSEDPAIRQRLFSRPYPLAWKMADGAAQARPDAFIYGIATIDETNRQLTIELVALVREDLATGPERDTQIEAEPFTAPIDLDDYLATGENYLAVRGRGRRGANKTDPIFNKYYRPSSDGEKLHPLNDPNCPIDLAIYYSGVKQEITYHPTPDSNQIAAKVYDPLPGENVHLEISRRDPTDPNRYGVLLAINGINTLFKQDLPVERPALWVLGPDRNMIVVAGFQLELGPDGRRDPFKVFGDAESRELEDLYKDDIGLISITVYRELDEDEEEATTEVRDKILETIENVPPLKDTSENRSQWGSSMVEQVFAQAATRGAIGSSEKSEVAVVNEVQFRRTKAPVFSTSIRYYKRQAGN